MSKKDKNIDPELKYMPIVQQIPNLKLNIFTESGDSILFSTNIDYPRAEYGFHHFIHLTKMKTEILKTKFEGKKKVYLVMNQFEGNIDNHENCIDNIAKKYFSLKSNIVNNDFYKLWEIMILFDFIDSKDKDKLVSIHLSDNSGTFCQSTICYRETFSKNTKSDKHYNFFITGPNLQEPDSTIKSYFKEKKVVNKGTSINELFNEKFEKADLITANGNSEENNVQEQGLFKLLVSQIYCALKSQKKGGTFVCRFFETFTKTSIKLITLLAYMYDKIYFIKPLISNFLSSERYIVCINFNDNKSKDKIIKELGETIKEINKNTNLKIVDLYSNLEIPKNIIHSVINMNINITNNQIKSINEIISFVNKEIYFGEEYHKRREQQIEGSEYWINLFLPNEKRKDMYKDIINHVINEQNDKTTELAEKLVFVET